MQPIHNSKSSGVKNMKKQKITKTKTLTKLMEETLVNVLIGSEAMNGVTYNKYKNYKNFKSLIGVNWKNIDKF